MDYCVNAGKQVSAAPFEEVAMTPGADMWVFEASFRVTWCPTFKIGYVISCLVQDTVQFKTNPSGGLWHMHKSDSSVALVQIHVVHHMYSAWDTSA